MPWSKDISPWRSFPQREKTKTPFHLVGRFGHQPLTRGFSNRCKDSKEPRKEFTPLYIYRHTHTHHMRCISCLETLGEPIGRGTVLDGINVPRCSCVLSARFRSTPKGGKWMVSFLSRFQFPCAWVDWEQPWLSTKSANGYLKRGFLSETRSPG